MPISISTRLSTVLVGRHRECREGDRLRPICRLNAADRAQISALETAHIGRPNRKAVQVGDTLMHTAEQLVQIFELLKPSSMQRYINSQVCEI